MSSRRRSLNNLRHLADRYFHTSPITEAQALALAALSAGVIASSALLAGSLYGPYLAVGVVLVGIVVYSAIVDRLTPDHPVLEERFMFEAETYQAVDGMAYDAFMQRIFCEGMSEDAVYRWLATEEQALSSGHGSSR